MNRYLRRMAPIKEPLRLTKYGRPYCDITPIDSEKESFTGENEAFHSTHQGQCARCGKFAPLAMAQYNTDRGLVARLICKKCWNEVKKNKSDHSADMTVMKRGRAGIFS